jgi:hypothetical protein
MPCFWQSVAGPHHMFEPMPVHVGFVVDKAALRQVFPQVFCFSQHHSISAQHSFIHHRHYIILATDGITIWKHQTERSCTKKSSYDFLGPLLICIWLTTWQRVLQWEANSSSASQEISQIYRYPNVIHKSPPIVTVLTNKIQSTPSSIFLQNQFNIIRPSTICLTTYVIRLAYPLLRLHLPQVLKSCLRGTLMSLQRNYVIPLKC